MKRRPAPTPFSPPWPGVRGAGPSTIPTSRFCGSPTPRGARAAISRPGSSARATTVAGQPRVPVPGGGRPGGRPARDRRQLSARRSGAGVAAVVLSLEQRAGRRAAGRGGRRDPVGPRGARAAGAPDAGGRSRPRPDRQLRRAVAAASEPGVGAAVAGAVRRLRRRTAAGVPPRDRAVLREHRAGRPQRARPAGRRLHLRQRPARAALRHAPRAGQPLPAGGGDRPGAGRTARARQHPDHHLASGADVAGLSGASGS